MDEASAFLTTLESTHPASPTACAGWTAHDLVAHLAAGAAEMAELAEAAAMGQAGRATGDFATREAPYVAMADDELRERLVVEAVRLGVAVEKLGSNGPGLTVPFAGRHLGHEEITLHGRSEAALHRWDLVGDDDVSAEHLAQPELTAHALGVLNDMLEGSPESVPARATSVGIKELRATFASPGHLDVVLVVDEAGARLELDEPRTRWTARADPATRLLALWGRRSERRPIAWDRDRAGAQAFASFLWSPTSAATAITDLSENR